jgi:hypothetical protein
MPQTRKPDMPVVQAIREAQIMHEAAVRDFPKLSRSGLTQLTLAEFQSAIEALRQAQAHWEVGDVERQNTLRAYRLEKEKAQSLQHEIEPYLTFVTRENPRARDLLRRLRTHSQPDTHLQRLLALMEMAQIHAAPLQAIQFPSEWPAQAKACMERLRDATARKLLLPNHSPAKTRRDQAFTVLRQKMAQLFTFAQFVFLDDPQSLRFYHSAYRHHKRVAARTKRRSKLTETSMPV